MAQESRYHSNSTCVFNIIFLLIREILIVLILLLVHVADLIIFVSAVCLVIFHLLIIFLKKSLLFCERTQNFIIVFFRNTITIDTFLLEILFLFKKTYNNFLAIFCEIICYVIQLLFLKIMHNGQ